MQSSNISCAYWSFDENNGSWIIDSGCRFAGYINDYAQCYCNHLTHFALLMVMTEGGKSGSRWIPQGGKRRF
jgi:hypothetical protein